MLIADQLFSPLSIDAITAFKVCQPELLFVTEASDCICWFSRKAHNPDRQVVIDGEERILITTEQIVSSDLTCSAWVDGLDCQVMIRCSALEEVLKSSYVIPVEMHRLLSKLHASASGLVDVS